MRDAATRRVRLALCLPDGTPLGLTPSFDVSARAYWPDAGALHAAAREAWGFEATILRLVRVDPETADEPERALYTAEVPLAPPVPLDTVSGTVFADDPLRMPWARPGGPRRHLEWAREVLSLRGHSPVGEPAQVRTWNLSSLWRIPTDRGTVWLKAVPPFFAHEGAVLERLQEHAVPRLIAQADGVCLLEEIPGRDLYGPDESAALRMVELLVDLQCSVPVETLPLMPRWPVASLAEPGARTLRAAHAGLDAQTRRTVSRLIDGLDRRASRLDDCGLPETLVHGDFHPGNFRGSASDAGSIALTLLDWGDSGIGHPLLDHAAFTERMPAPVAARATEHWIQLWKDAVPGSDPRTALELLAPVGALRQAILYRGFLDRIEESERVYHASDPARWLRRAAERVSP